MMAELNYVGTGANHTGSLTAQDLARRSEEIKKNMPYSVKRYEKMYTYWLNQESIQLLIIHYEDLKNNLLEELKRISDFLGSDTDREIMNCVKQNAEGSFHRQKIEHKSKNFLYDILNRSVTNKMKITYSRVLEMVDKRKALMVH